MVLLGPFRRSVWLRDEGDQSWKVDHGFDNGADGLEQPGPKRRRVGDAGPPPAGGLPEDRDRHLAWARKTPAPAAKTSWRPKPVYRVAAKRQLAMLDNQIRVSTPLVGLSHFRDDGSKVWSDWRSWPHVGLGHDLGSDILCAAWAAERHFELNFTKTPDVDHGCQRAVIEADSWALYMAPAGFPRLVPSLFIHLSCGLATGDVCRHGGLPFQIRFFWLCVASAWHQATTDAGSMAT